MNTKLVAPLAIAADAAKTTNLTLVPIGFTAFRVSMFGVTK